MLAEQMGFVAAHFLLVALLDVTLRLQMGADQTQAVAGRRFDGRIQDAAPEGQDGAGELVGQVGAVMPLDDREPAQQGEVAVLVGAVHPFRDRQVHPAAGEALLQVGQVFPGADLADPEDVGLDVGDHLHQGPDLAFGLGLVGKEPALALAFHLEVVAQVVAHERDETWIQFGGLAGAGVLAAGGGVGGGRTLHGGGLRRGRGRWRGRRGGRGGDRRRGGGRLDHGRLERGRGRRLLRRDNAPRQGKPRHQTCQEQDGSVHGMTGRKAIAAACPPARLARAGPARWFTGLVGGVLAGRVLARFGLFLRDRGLRIADLVLEVLAGALELAHALADAPGQFRKLLGPEEQQDNDENDDPLGTTGHADESQIREHGDWM